MAVHQGPVIADMADIPGGASGLLCRDYKGKEADRLVTRIDPGMVSRVAELGGHERQAADQLGRWNTHREERRVIETSPAAVTLAAISDRRPRPGRRRSPPSTRRAFSLPAGVVALEISSRIARVQALQERWDYLRAGLDLILDQRGADMADLPGGDLPGGANGLLARDYKGKKPTSW
jgi:hypothetical protein